jgi:hypothetical protein
VLFELLSAPLSVPLEGVKFVFHPDHERGAERPMPLVERAPGGTSLIDVLDRVLDKGIVIDAWGRVSLVGIDLVTVEARVVVASIDTCLRYAEAMGIERPQPQERT